MIACLHVSQAHGHQRTYLFRLCFPFCPNGESWNSPLSIFRIFPNRLIEKLRLHIFCHCKESSARIQTWITEVVGKCSPDWASRPWLKLAAFVLHTRNRQPRCRQISSEGKFLVKKFEFRGNFGMRLSWGWGHSKIRILSPFWYEFGMSLLWACWEWHLEFVGS